MVTDGKASRWDQVEYLSKDERLMQSVLLMPSGTDPFGTRSGRKVNGTGLQATVTGTSPEYLNVTRGTCVISSDGTGPYLAEIPSTKSVALPARPSSGQSRIILAIVRVYDVDDGAGPGRELKVEAILGTPSATPVAPALPALSFEVARLVMPSSGTVSVTQSTVRAVAAGGILPVATTADRDAIASPWRGLVVDNGQTNLLERYNGTAWKQLVEAGATVDSGWVPVLGASPFTSTLEVRKVGTLVVMRGVVQRSSGSSASNVTAATVPSGYRPSVDHEMPVGTPRVAASIPCRGLVTTTGLVQIQMGSAFDGSIACATTWYTD